MNIDTAESERASAQLELKGLDEHVRQLKYRPRLVGSSAWVEANADVADAERWIAAIAEFVFYTA